MPWGRKSHFFCTVDSACRQNQERIAGERNRGITAVLAGWKGALEVSVRHSMIRGDIFDVRFIPWHESKSARGRGVLISEGILDYDLLGPQLESFGPMVRLDSDVLAALEFVRAKQIMMEGIDTNTT